MASKARVEITSTAEGAGVREFENANQARRAFEDLIAHARTDHYFITETANNGQRVRLERKDGAAIELSLVTRGRKWAGGRKAVDKRRRERLKAEGFVRAEVDIPAGRRDELLDFVAGWRAEARDAKASLSKHPELGTLGLDWYAGACLSAASDPFAIHIHEVARGWRWCLSLYDDAGDLSATTTGLATDRDAAVAEAEAALSAAVSGHGLLAIVRAAAASRAAREESARRASV